MAIKGITVYLLEKTLIGYDAFKTPLYEQKEIPVENVLVAPGQSSDLISQTNLNGKKIAYTLAIPKNDTHNWENKQVRFFDATWQTAGIALQGIDDLIPLDWNKKVMVERYE